MRTTLLLLALLSHLSSTAFAQAPAPTGCSIECPEDSAHPGLKLSFPADMSQCHVDPAVVECRCYDRCGGDAQSSGGATGAGVGGSGASSGQQQSAGVPPILAALIGLVALVVAPVFTFELRRDSADIRAEDNRANESWSAHRDEIRGLELDGIADKSRSQKETVWITNFKRELADKTRTPPVPASYHWIPAAGPKRDKDARRWGDGRYCTELIRATDQFLIGADAEATEESLKFLPTTAEALAKVKHAAGDELLRSSGLARMAQQRADIARMYEESIKFESFMAALKGCDRGDLESFNACFNALLSAEPPAAVKSVVERLVGNDLAESLERVRKFTAFYPRFVRRLQIQIEKLAIAGPRCN